MEVYYNLSSVQRHPDTSYVGVTLLLFQGKVFLVMPYAITPPFAPFNLFLHCSLTMHITFASLSSSDFTSHACLTPSSYLLPVTFLSLLPSTSVSSLFQLAAPHVQNTSKTSIGFYHPSFISHQICALLFHSSPPIHSK